MRKSPLVGWDVGLRLAVRTDGAKLYDCSACGEVWRQALDGVAVALEPIDVMGFRSDSEGEGKKCRHADFARWAGPAYKCGVDALKPRAGWEGGFWHIPGSDGLGQGRNPSWPGVGTSGKFIQEILVVPNRRSGAAQFRGRYAAKRL